MTVLRRFDVVIAGAGPAGLSASLILGRACRSVLLCDTGTPRSWASKRMYAYLSRDGIPPARFRGMARQQLRNYSNVVVRDVEVTRARRLANGGFSVALADGTRVQCRKLLIATGMFDLVPQVEGLLECFGRSVFQCPYCDGWELRGRKLAVYGRRQRGLEMARALTAWTDKIVLCTDGPSRYTADECRDLVANGIELIEQRIESLDHARGRLRAVRFRNGENISCDGLFFDTPSRGQSRLAESLGCRFSKNGGVMSGKFEATSVPGVYVAGNIIRDVQLSIVAAAEGARAAFGINRALTREDFVNRAARPEGKARSASRRDTLA
jgi:thioredoxin reductase